MDWDFTLGFPPYTSTNRPLRRGDTLYLDLALTDPATGLGFDISTASAVRATGKRRFKDADSAAYFRKTLGGGVTITDGPNGLLTVKLDPADTSALPGKPSNIIVDVQVVKGGDTMTAAVGLVRIMPDVSVTTP